MTSFRNVWVGLIAVAIIAIGGYFYPQIKGALGAITGETNYDTLGISGLKLGSTCNNSSGSSGCQKFTKFLSGTCNLTADTSITATTTGTATCATTGSVAGDQVFVELATTTTKMAAQYMVVGTVAGTDSTTVRLLNLTGVTAVPAATNGFGSTTPYWIVR